MKLSLIGIGTGNPDHVTGQAIKAMRAADAILIPQKGAGKEDLADLRKNIVETCLGETAPRLVTFDLPVRDPAMPYQQRVARWHDAIAEVWRSAMAEVPQALHVALLVWGDPSLYDSTLRIAERLTPKPEITVIPGITALQALTAAHAIPLNSVGGPVTITTGRQLRDNGWPAGAETVAVMLDAGGAYEVLPDARDFHIWWGAYLGMPNEVLVSGVLADVADEITKIRAAARAAHGWIMDIYLLRKNGTPPPA